MNNLKSTTILLASILTLSVFPDAYTGAAPAGRGTGDDYSVVKTQGQKTVTYSGITSGALEGRIRVGGNHFVITKDTRIYKTDEGPVSVGTFVADAPVYAVCVKKNKTAYARLVIVSDRRTSGDGVAGTVDPDAPR